MHPRYFIWLKLGPPEGFYKPRDASFFGVIVPPENGVWGFLVAEAVPSVLQFIGLIHIFLVAKAFPPRVFHLVVLTLRWTLLSLVSEGGPAPWAGAPWAWYQPPPPTTHALISRRRPGSRWPPKSMRSSSSPNI